MAEEIINKVSQSALLTVDLEQFFPKEEIQIFDLKPFLFMELILKEKDFRAALLKTDWAAYKNQIVGIYCSADAVIPVWAYMLVQLSATMQVILGNESTSCVNDYQSVQRLIRKIQGSGWFKGCGEKPMGDFAFLEVQTSPAGKKAYVWEPAVRYRY
jgi:hypothetical protein